MMTSSIDAERAAATDARAGHARPTAVVVAVAPEDNDDVLRLAWVRATTMGLRLVVCTVVADEHARAAAYAALVARTRDLLPGDATPELDVRVGDRADEVLACASAHDTALLVLGMAAEREGLLSRLFRPGLPTALLRGAACPLLVTRYSPATGRILAATDLDDPTHPVLRAAAAEVARGGGQVHVLHCVSPAPLPAVDLPEALPTGEIVDAARLELDRALAACALPATTAHVEVGPAAATILELAQQLAVDLIIVGTHGRTGPARVLLGSVAEAVLRDAPCNVMVVRLGAAAPDVA